MNRPQYVLGVSMSNHDRSACLLRDGEIVAAVAEERLDRRKKSEGFYEQHLGSAVLPPYRAITAVLHEAGLTVGDIDRVVCGRSILPCRDDLLNQFPFPPEKVVEIPVPGHHIAHACSAFFTSPFENAAVLVLDEQGHRLEDDRFERMTWYTAHGTQVVPIRQFYGDSETLSLGMFMDAFATFTGLSEAKQPSAGKLMGLAAVGQERQQWPSLVTTVDDGDAYVRLSELDSFFASVLPRRVEFEGGIVRQLDDLLAKYWPVHWSSNLAADLAFKAQAELEGALLHINRHLKAQVGSENLAYAGGVALNCTANAKLSLAGWRDVFVHPAATDDGNAVGLAYYGQRSLAGKHRRPELFNPMTGPRYSQKAVEEAVHRFGLGEWLERTDMSDEAAERLSRGETLCWFLGRSEWGPRALGGRSIVADPTVPGIKALINSRIKHREPFRPFGISGTPRGVEQALDVGAALPSLAPYMLAVARARDTRLSQLQHQDGSIRYQIVQRAWQPEWFGMIEAFGRRSGVECIVNTSFNVLGEPLVETPSDAVRQFVLSGAQALLINGFRLDSADVPREYLRQIRRQAFQAGGQHPLKVALGIEAAGYCAAAITFLEDQEFGEEAAEAEGKQVLRAYYSLHLRGALLKNEHERSTELSKYLLAMAEFDGAVLEAASVLEATEQPETQAMGQFFTHIGRYGSAFRHASGIWAGTDG
ncbi:nodulation protein-related protein (plasmid) [Deinococcus radiodurans R1 = ATCC 13939 = DSM 20539]|jgi:Predicted carbamoyl transferase, NodU family|uniref:Nodulation protein-related protein n=4 Tax=Deinococcus radiodurans TaxID=1299 RepID=Q9RZF3_DEIRA|nr:carbamoyltransferase [Deinococcus radiodurans]AAF12674.1 nodulation protein-related protein [Deinococcus radiodurans R1 = ATCC 13939 = DSM 20539]ANC73330.1 hypothetical protein A2G07_15880 [Deinococcus radiodurans R1 = ATCC 13939 = DSM 20539]QEM73379.1 nodulation protein-related protein [Deinococcus radiodurans]UDL02299.1 nodulation protein-related protein [Deinococcus radiodurans R1 = ATCC 13939 = DSM 20539]UID72110.1 nodulation protein-related protein [Deinococcus radiodurans R1 = ATCC 13